MDLHSQRPKGGAIYMTCEEAERLVMPYINGSITDQELEGFLKHIITARSAGRSWRSILP